MKCGRWMVNIRKIMAAQLCGTSLDLQFEARMQAGVCSTVTSRFGQSNVFAHQIQKLAQIKKHTFLLISSECFFCRQIYCSHYFAHMQSYCSRNYSAWSFYILSFKPAQCRNVALGSILKVSSCIYSYIHPKSLQVCTS